MTAIIVLFTIGAIGYYVTKGSASPSNVFHRRCAKTRARKRRR